MTFVNYRFKLLLLWFVSFFTLSCFLLVPSTSCAADDSVCARVKLEIKQELTLERQAFDAHMRINNGLSHITLENVNINVNFSDEDGASILASTDPDNVDALFFIRLDSMSNIDDVEGSGTVSASTSADIHWLIIPAPGASDGISTGKLYYVGATLSYTIGGEEQVTEVTPDYIFVKPMPQLTLDYFIPLHVYGDDAFTTEIESPVPFGLGVRVGNNGTGTAKSLKIESAQPKIIENELGLLIDFAIEGCEVNGGEVSPSLLVDFGDIGPNSAKIARWIMTCTLSGEFVEFTADFSHSDELGGELTSLLEATNTHFLVREVLVDSPGKDSIYDFLALDDDIYRIFESENIDTVVTDQSSSSGITGSDNNFTLSSPVTAGFMYVKLTDPTGGSKELRGVVRSDGKIIKTANAWISKTRNESHDWDYFLNIFDANTTSSYAITYIDQSAQPHAPVLQFVSDRVGVESQQISFIVEASDADGTIPLIETGTLPAQAGFTDQGDGTGVFDWTPAIGQAGTYTIIFRATDGALEDSQEITITINPVDDTDGDGMLDAWELEHFGTLDRDGSGDFDGDGISDLDEYLAGTNPAVANQAPADPVIETPEDASEITVLTPALVIYASIDPDGDPVTYTFEVYSDQEITNLVSAESYVETTTWSVPIALEDNTWYYWRVQATDGYAVSSWVYGSFFVNTLNDAPGPFNTTSPAEVDTLTPTLEVTNSSDVDRDILTYTFEVYTDSSLSTLIASEPDIPEGDNGTTTWVVNTQLDNNNIYYWKAIVTDEHGLTAQTEAAAFLVYIENTAPAAPAIVSPESGSEVAQLETDLTVLNAIDEQGDDLSYFFELDTADTMDSPSLQVSDEIFEQEVNTTWPVTSLVDNTMYYWRVKANDGYADSDWTTGSFFVNTANDAPTTPSLRNPADEAWVDTLTPLLEINSSIDIDNDAITYAFEVYADEGQTMLVAQSEGDATAWTLAVTLNDNTWYYWRARATDEHGLASDWMAVSRFFVNNDNFNDPPEITLTAPSQDVLTNEETVQVSWDDQDPDSNASVSLYFDADNSGQDGTLIVTDIQEDPDGQDDSYLWDISELPDGVYYLYATIADTDSSITSYGEGSVTIDRTAPNVQVMPEAGTYTAPQSVTLTADEPGVIYYTIDGTEPTTESSQYVEPIEISETTTLMCMAVDEAGNVGDTATLAYIIETEPQGLGVAVQTSQGEAIPNVKVYAFTGTDSYTGNYVTTDEGGQAVFDPQVFADGNYKFRVDYLGGQFWSQVVALPETTSLDVVIDVETVKVTVTMSSSPVEGVRVYLFSNSGSYLGIYLISDGSGVVTYTLPVGMSFSFRADVLGSQYWSEATTIQPDVTNVVSVSSGGGAFRITVQKDAVSPMEGLRVYLFNTSGSYLGRYVTTGTDGLACFDVPEGTYRVRADYLGYQFWSEDTLVSADTDIDLTIPHADVDVTVNGMFLSSAQPLEGLRVYLFSPSGSYLGQYLTTGTDGRVTFSLPERAYTLRADYLGFQYWSGEFTWDTATVEVPLADAEVTVVGSGLPQPGVRIYVFSSTGSYLSVSEYTDAAGQVVFRLPAQAYTFRADYEGSQYWSDVETLMEGQTNPVAINVGGGSFTLTVLKGQADPLVGVNCYVFNESGSYLSMSETTDESGQVSFDLATGSYMFRTDYLGYQFWTNVVQVPATLDLNQTITHQDVTVSFEGLLGSDSRPLEGKSVYLFTPSGSYLGVNAATDANGQVLFILPDQPYKVRADYLGLQFFSDEFTGQDTTITVHEGTARVQVSVAGQVVEGVSVYVFSSTGTYLGLNASTDSDGIVEFRLPEETYKFRANYQGSEYWATAGVVRDVATNVDLNTGGGEFVLTIDTGQSPLVGSRVYVFNAADSYLGMYSTSNEAGQVSFILADGSYKFRVDHLGYQFWSEVYEVPTDLSGVFTIAHQDVTVTVQGVYQSPEPVEAIRVYLFSLSDSYLGVYQVTDGSGQVSFTLPDRQYKVRCDYRGRQFWSEVFQSQDITVSIPEGLVHIHVTRSGQDLQGAKVYLFTEGGSYLGWFETTDSAGTAEFIIPNFPYMFRIDEGGAQYWTGLITTSAGQVSTVEVDLDE